MARTTSEAVSNIIEVDSGIPLDPFIETANALVEEICEPLGHNDVRLELIERWLSAHFYAIRDVRPTSERAGSVGEIRQMRLDLNLDQTIYGQQAKMLDTKGGLNRINKGGFGRPQLAWLGSTD